MNCVVAGGLRWSTRRASAIVATSLVADGKGTGGRADEPCRMDAPSPLVSASSVADEPRYRRAGPALARQVRRRTLEVSEETRRQGFVVGEGFAALGCVA